VNSLIHAPPPVVGPSAALWRESSVVNKPPY
jgi:hypothetical protein